MKILFCDIDGVMLPFHSNTKRIENPNFRSSFELFDEKCIKVLNEIIQETDCEIVVSSDWRNYFNLEQLQNIFELNKIIKKPIAVTKTMSYYTAALLESNRIQEIEEWIDENKPETWVAVDDMYLSDLGEDHFVVCKKPYKEGIKQTGVKEKIIKKLLNNGTQK